jgi:hypothetical protein
MWRRIRFAAVVLAVLPLAAVEHRGTVKLGDVPIPGATVTAQQGEKRVATITDAQGTYVFPDLAEGTWTLQVEMSGFAPLKRDIQLPQSSTGWELTMLPLAEITRGMPEPPKMEVRIANPPAASPKSGAPKPSPTNTPGGFQRTDLNASNDQAAETTQPARDVLSTELSADLAQRAADGFLINGSVNNGAASPFSQFPAFGNNRRPGRSLYTSNLGFSLDNSATDARRYSLTGQDTPRPSYNRLQGTASFGGPLKIPGLLRRNGPNLTLNYQWVRNRSADTQSALMPADAIRGGDFSGVEAIVIDPLTGRPFPGNVVPKARISRQAEALLKLYPLPNFDPRARYNYQVPVVTAMHQDSFQSRGTKQVGRRDNVNATFAFQSTRADNSNVFHFLDTGSTLGVNAGVNWRHNFNPRSFINIGMQFSRQTARTTPYFANRINVSGEAGVAGNLQDPINWGPPSLNFAGGIAPLNDALFSATRNQTSALSYDSFVSRGRHNFTYGAAFRRQQFNTISQQDPRGTFTFTGAAAGSDFAGFLLGIPDTSSVAYGNADKYFRANSWDAHITDDWRLRTGLTINAGVRWEYWSPITEKYGRLVNLDAAPGFTSVTALVGSRLIHPDKNGFAPRVALAWRPLAASSMVVRAGYGIYYDTSVYQPIAMQMAQQAPLSNSLRVQNSAENPLTLADGFHGSPSITSTTFGIDPNFRIGYAQTWQLSVQRDLPWALQMTATYLGTKGTRGVQQFLPNTFPPGAVNPCAGCPMGFSYMTSNGNSAREAGTIQLRRRLRGGLTSEAQYTWAKAIDNAALGGRGQGGFLIAQNWLDLRAERGLSNFDQRHVVTLQAQFTTGVGAGAFFTGRKAAFFREWTVASQISAGTGFPLTPIYFAAVKGTGVTGNIRPDYTGAAVYDAPAGLALNPAAYSAPAAGQWGNAGRNSITGPSQFTMNASAGRTFQWSDRLNADLRVDASNALNHPVFPSWNTVIGSAQFGLPNPANAMRTIQTTLRVRF